MTDSAAPAPVTVLDRQRSRTLPTMRIAIPVYVGAIVAVEIVLVFFNTAAGLIGHAVLVALLLGQFLLNSWGTTPATVGTSTSYHTARALPALALVPLLRLLSLVMPFGALPVWSWYLLVGVPLFLATVLLARAMHYSWADLGLRRVPWVTQLLIALSGPPLGLITYLLVRPEPRDLLGRQPTFAALGGAIGALLFAGLAEEVLFRGLLQRATRNIVWVTILYGALYIGALSPGLLLIMTVVGGYFSWCVARTGGIWGVALANGTLAASALVICPLLFS